MDIDRIIREYKERRARCKALADELDGIKDQIRYWDLRRRDIEETLERVKSRNILKEAQ